MAMKKSIGRTLAHIDVAANSSVRIHKDFFNTPGIITTYLTLRYVVRSGFRNIYPDQKHFGA